MLRLKQGLVEFKYNKFWGLLWSLRGLTQNVGGGAGSNLGEPALELVPSPFE
jgi:hypothetical protein